MQRSRIIAGMGLMAAALFACLTNREALADDPAVRFQGAVEAYSKLDRSGQEAWLADLFRRRAEPTFRLTLTGEELQNHLKLQQDLLAGMRDGKNLRPDGLRTLLTEIDIQETRLITKLSDEFKAVTRKTFQGDRTQLDRRLKVWDNIQQDWIKAGRPWLQQAKMIEWLQAATAGERISSKGQLPPMPDFSTPADSPRVAARGAGSKAGTPVGSPQPRSAAKVATDPKSTGPVPPAMPDAPAPAASPSTGTTSTAASTTDERPNEAPPAAIVGQTDATGSDSGTPASPAIAPPTGLVTRGGSDRQATPAPVDPLVDATELNTRIWGYNMALGDLSSQLQNDDQLDTDRLEAIVRTLADLNVRRVDMQMYWNLLPAESRQGMRPIRPLAPAVSLIAQKTAAARKRLENFAKAGAKEGTDAELERLDRINKKLAEFSDEQRQQ